MHRAIPLGLRTLQFLIAVTILGLSVAMVRAQVIGSAPTTISYSTFTGAFGIVVGLVGVASLFVSFIPDLVPLVLDGLAALLFLAGGIAWAVGLRGIQACNDGPGMLYNHLLNWGSIGSGPDGTYGVIRPDDDQDSLYNRLRGNCQRAQADEVLQFISVAFALGLIALGYLQMRRGRGASGYV